MLKTTINIVVIKTNLSHLYSYCGYSKVEKKSSSLITHSLFKNIFYFINFK